MGPTFGRHVSIRPLFPLAFAVATAGASRDGPTNGRTEELPMNNAGARLSNSQRRCFSPPTVPATRLHPSVGLSTIRTSAASEETGQPTGGVPVAPAAAAATNPFPPLTADRAPSLLRTMGHSPRWAVCSSGECVAGPLKDSVGAARHVFRGFRGRLELH